MLSHRKICTPFILLLLLSTTPSLTGAAGSYLMMPYNCEELLPDNAPFLGYFRAVAQGSVATDKRFSERLLKILALRDQVKDAHTLSGENPIDVLIRKTICYYRQQEAKLRQIPYDDPGVLAFLKKDLPILEMRIEAELYSAELSKAQEEKYNRRIRTNRKLINNLEKSATQKARKSYNNISNRAKKKAATQ